ncbi:MAG: hypothetical protein IT270_03570 [Saprospiraceae bacterium]|nr:hypothetical protein [Saprospiraceae bacterium]
MYFNTNILSFLDPYKPVFILKTTTLNSLTAAWLVKGEVPPPNIPLDNLLHIPYFCNPNT